MSTSTTLLFTPTVPQVEQRITTTHASSQQKQVILFGLRTISHSTDALVKSSTVKAIRQTIKDWLEIIYNRLGDTRLNKQNALSTEKIITDHNFEEDKQFVKSYKILCDDVKDHLSNLGVDRTILILVDEKQRIQGLASVITKSESLYVSAIMSAPYGLKMHGQTAPEHRELVKKGVGTTLMRQICELAKQNQKERLELKPLNGSFTFYRDHLQMTLVRRNDAIYFTLDLAKPLPEALNVPSGNLLPSLTNYC